MGLTVSRKTAKNLAVRRKNERILTVSRYLTIDSCVSVFHRDMKHAGSLESTKDA